MLPFKTPAISCSVKVDTYSKSKYGRVLAEVGGWDWLQRLLVQLRIVADKHQTSIANVATRWVLQQPQVCVQQYPASCLHPPPVQVAAAIIGARNANHVQDYPAVFAFSLDEEDLGRIDEMLATGTKPRGDCYSWERGTGAF